MTAFWDGNWRMVVDGISSCFVLYSIDQHRMDE